MSQLSLPSDWQPIYEEGESLLADIAAHLKRVGEDRRREKDVDHPPPYHARPVTSELRDRAHLWFNKVAVEILPYTTFHRDHLNKLLRRVNAAIGAHRYYEAHSVPGYEDYGGSSESYVEHNVELSVEVRIAWDECQQVMEETLRLIRTAVVPPHRGSGTSQHPQPNTAFILMWMDKSRPELVDVHETVKRVFAEFGISARRADEVQHQDRITDLVLQEIARTEFLFADLTGERPNVYYEVGFAHALGRRPILYRHSGTALHFDLSVHNVPEYSNLTELASQLRERLVAMVGARPRQDKQEPVA